MTDEVLEEVFLNEDAIEAAAKAIWKDLGGTARDWANATHSAGPTYRSNARAAITAFLDAMTVEDYAMATDKATADHLHDDLVTLYADFRSTQNDLFATQDRLRSQREATDIFGKALSLIVVHGDNRGGSECARIADHALEEVGARDIDGPVAGKEPPLAETKAVGK